MTPAQLRMLEAYASGKGPGLVSHSAKRPHARLVELGYITRDWAGKYSATEAGVTFLRERAHLYTSKFRQTGTTK